MKTLIAIALLCAVNAQAQTRHRTVTPHQETVEEYLLRGEVATLKDDILALHKDLEVQKVEIEGPKQNVDAQEPG